MMKLMTIAGLALVTACAAQPHTEASTEVLPPDTAYAETNVMRASPASPERFTASCDIYAAHTAKGLRLEAIAQAGQAVQGTYQFVITAQGSGGSSDISQGGPVDLAAGQAATVGLAEISNRRYRAVLTLRDADGEFCRRERSSSED